MDKLLKKLEEIEAAYGSEDMVMMPNGNWCHPTLTNPNEKRKEITKAVNEYVNALCKQGKNDFLVEQYNRNRVAADHISDVSEIPGNVGCSAELDNEWHNESI